MMAVAGALTLATPAQAAATVSCTAPPHSANGEGAGVLNGSHALDSAPYASCSNVTTLASGTMVYYRCFYVNDYGNLWWYVRVAGTSTYGWESDDNLTSVWYDDNGDGYMTYYAC
ncbi:hypothetical protein OG909_25815 [Streptomyces sp. NBC_01754]|uniref:hypothetical protein n=1 Tax=Streptomyces sp. NBC_01754 TaxID=2975930 RepID=UPI002DD9E4EF|nr:hypothetical protein [Streptomyces sp. NBC_01754]WSC95428.1 hypothetical protein OG909_25815 [Streptomyces sp. NBC_01754]